MLFNSFQFLLFFPIVTTLYFLVPHKWRWLLLLLASCIFYTAFIPVYIFILFFTIIIDYIAAILIENQTGPKRKLFLVISIIANVGVLAIFKYYNFLVGNTSALLNFLHIRQQPLPLWNIILPIGLSFHTFQAMSYTIEVYRGNQKPERHFGIYALYVMFYPQLVAGPIERPQNLLHQFREEHFFDNDRVAKGLRLMLWGLFMKVVIADRLAVYVNPVFSHIHEHNGTSILLAVIFFSIQIYCDFAGYSYIAIGSAQVMGFKLMNNFNRPYFAKTIAEFWSRWHISLSTWFRDYVYIPLGGSKVSMPRWYFNLFIVFLISGLWHGADWKFVVWGAINGFYLVFAIIIKKWAPVNKFSAGLSKLPRTNTFIQVSTTFFLCAFAWIFFRADSFRDALLIINKILFHRGSLFIGDYPALLPYCFYGIMILLLVEFKNEYWPQKKLLLNNPNVYIRYAVYLYMIITILLLGIFDGGQFIYFQF